MEDRTEQMIARHGLEPLRMSDEGTIGFSEADLLGRIARHLKVSLPQGALPAVDHPPLKGSKARLFADRFRAQNPSLVVRLEAHRGDRLARLDIRG